MCLQYKKSLAKSIKVKNNQYFKRTKLTFIHCLLCDRHCSNNLYLTTHLIQPLHRFFDLPIKQSMTAKRWVSTEYLLWLKLHQPQVLFIDSITHNFWVPTMCQTVRWALEKCMSLVLTQFTLMCKQFQYKIMCVAHEIKTNHFWSTDMGSIKFKETSWRR